MRTSHSHPLEIAEIEPAAGYGKLGITFCPGKKQDFALTGAWDRDLLLDISAITRWNAAAVLTLVEEHELTRLQVPHLGETIRDAHIDWYHLPIRDRGVPDDEFERAWESIGEGLRARLAAGFNVLVHCMGGLGRAGTIASRLLVELGWKAGDAAAEVRRVRPGAIETDGQMEYIHACSSAATPEAKVSVEAIRNRAIGALVGLAVGDAVGTTLEFKSRDSYPRLVDMVGGGPFRLEAGQWTDDTAMALALADSLLACGQLDEHDLTTRFVAWHEEGAYSSTGSCFDIGITTREALQRFRRTGNPIAGSTDPMSAGNGSLMRLAPVAIRFWNEEAALRDAARRQSATTHAASEAVEACEAFALRLASAIAGASRGEVLAQRQTNFAGGIGAIEAGSWRGKHRDAIRSSGYVVHSLEAALWCVARTASFEEAILLAANLGDDADTVAAITGQLAGALYGFTGIPQPWLARLALQGRIISMAGSLFDASGAGPAIED